MKEMHNFDKRQLKNKMQESLKKGRKLRPDEKEKKVQKQQQKAPQPQQMSKKQETKARKLEKLGKLEARKLELELVKAKDETIAQRVLDFLFRVGPSTMSAISEEMRWGSHETKGKRLRDFVQDRPHLFRIDTRDGPDGAPGAKMDHLVSIVESHESFCLIYGHPAMTTEAETEVIIDVYVTQRWRGSGIDWLRKLWKARCRLYRSRFFAI